MGNVPYTDEELKNILKTFISEKRQSGEEMGANRTLLQKKFLSKLPVNADAQEEIEKLKGQLDKVKPALKKLFQDLQIAREEIATLKENAHLSSSQENTFLEELKKEEKEKATLQFQLQEAVQMISVLRSEKQAYEQKNRTLALECEEAKAAALSQEGIKKLEGEKEHLASALKEKENELSKRIEQEERETRRFESERQRLVEKLAETLSQLQRQTEIIQDLREEALSHKQEGEAVKEHLSHVMQEGTRLQNALRDETRTKEELLTHIHHLQAELAKERGAFALMRQEWEKKESELLLFKEKGDLNEGIETLQLHIQQLESQYQEKNAAQKKEMDVACAKLQADLALSQEEINKLQQAAAHAEEEFKRALTKKESILEEMLSKGYAKMRDFSQRHSLLLEEKLRIEKLLEEKLQRVGQTEQELATLKGVCQSLKTQCEEREAEIRKAQQHLAKKVKEATILHDLLERQKFQTAELQKVNAEQGQDIERLHNQLHQQRIQEEQGHAAAKERILAAERLAKEWQEKLFGLQQEYQQMKSHLLELQKIKQQHEKLSATMTTLKQFLSKTLGMHSSEFEEREKKLSSLEDFFEL